MDARRDVFVAPEEYLARERDAEVKNAYLNGGVFAMAGASEAHNLIVGNLVATMITRLRGRPYKTYPSDMLRIVREQQAQYEGEIYARRSPYPQNYR